MKTSNKKTREDHIFEIASERLNDIRNNDVQAAERAVQKAEALYTAFECFVELYRSLKGNTASSEQCWEDEAFKQKFIEVGQFIKYGMGLKIKKKKEPNYKEGTSTKSKSFHSLNKEGAAMRVYETIETAKEPLSRKEISEASGLPINTTCGQVVPLIDMGAIYVSGVKKDPDSGKEVEVLSCVDRNSLI